MGKVVFLSKKTSLVAVDIGSHSIKLAQLFPLKGNSYELLSFGIMPLPPESIVDGAVKNMDNVVDALTRLLKAENIKTKFAVASVSGEAVIIKKIKLPYMTYEELGGKIKGEAEQYIPFDIEDVSMDYQIIQTSETAPQEENKEDENLMEVLLVAVQKEAIDNRLEILQEAGLKPVIIDLDVFAMMNAAGFSTNLEDENGIALVDLGSSFTHINIIIKGNTHFTRDFRVGGMQCTEKLMSQLGATYEEADAYKKGEIPSNIEKGTVIKIIVESLGPIIEEIQNALNGFEEATGKPIEKVWLSGGGTLINGVTELFREQLGVPVEILDPLKSLKINRKKFDLDCVAQMAPIATVALGLATRRFDYEN
ncbi:MAG: type IV pilus assembly protein PilM [Nitrospinota bacterium]|nr:type IV pilus assembly protein PilM [Nitrospinota bacterium]